MANLNNTGLALFRQPIASWIFPLAVALYITVFFNAHIYGLVKLHHKQQSITDILFFASVYCGVFFMVHFAAALLSLGKLMKGWLIMLLLLCAIIAYPRDQYTVVFDDIMLQNVIETDTNEAGELLSWRWIIYVLLFGGLPALLISLIPVKTQTLGKDLLHRFIAILATGVLLLMAILPFYRSHALLAGSKLSIEDHIAPTAFLYATFNYIHDNYPNINATIVPVGNDAILHNADKHPKKILLVIIAGESARTANFSLAGYPRNTNPLLGNRLNNGNDLVFYPNFTACSTSTAVSIPCIFSPHTQQELNVAEEKHRENLLDVLAHAGMDVLWVNNNSGCKNVCNRVRHIEMGGRKDDASCNEHGCADMVMLKVLETEIQAHNDHLAIVLHMKGSHGPAYYKRAPGHEIFKPACYINHLQECTREEIVNSYDNTLAYTDKVLDGIMTLLETHQQQRDTALFYVSDHGESLGENGLYLHGMPYDIAPDEQIHIPAILWLSPGFRQRMSVDTECLRTRSNEKYSHDHVFHTLLGLLDIRTTVYNDKYDITLPCRKIH
jgi:lipid A ethanolaminephosphotransferase